MSEHALQKPIKVNIFAKNGATSAEILLRMRSNKVRESLYYSSIITITAGGNDLIHAWRQYKKTQNPYVFQQVLQVFPDNLDAIIQDIYSLKSAISGTYMIRLVGLYNPFPQIAGSDAYIQSFNRSLHRFANGNIAVADIQYPFKLYGRKVLSIDGLNPNGKGYQLIAKTLYHLGYSPLIQ